LGIKFLDKNGKILRPVPGELINMIHVDPSGLDKKIANCEIAILCDVNNKLLGPEGAATVFGPQKGATKEQVPFLEQFLQNFAGIFKQQTGKDMAAIKHGGAAGGATAGLYTWLNAKLVNGIGYFLELTGFDEALNRSDLVITGEGSLDNQTLQGKGPYGVAVKAKEKGIRVIGLAGRIESNAGIENYFDELININKEPVDVVEAMENTRENLVQTAKMLGRMLNSMN
jgi:glycerate kinase